MILIIGGAWQGKLEYAKETFSLTDADIYTCTDGNIDFSRRCIYALEEFTAACIRHGVDPVAFFRAHREEWQACILICRDISGGVVPMEAEQRRWRQDTGRLCQYLAGEAECFSRIFCGLEQRIK